MRTVVRGLVFCLVFVGVVSVCGHEASAAIITQPTGLNAGEQYRLVFVTNATHNGVSSDIATYNTFVTAEANQAPALTALGTVWTAIASTDTVDARDNTSTVPGAGVPIYDLRDNKVADDYSDLWDGSIDSPIQYTQLDNYRAGGYPWVLTGTTSTGVASSDALGGAEGNTIGDTPYSDHTWIAYNTVIWNSGAGRFYAISGVLTAVPEPGSLAALAGMGVVGLGIGWRKRRGKAT